MSINKFISLATCLFVLVATSHTLSADICEDFESAAVGDPIYADVQSRTEFEVSTTSSVVTPSSLQVTLEGSVFARTPVSQSVDLYNVIAETWEEVDTRDATRFADASIVVDLDGDLSRFVANPTGEIRARVRFRSERARQKFASNTDLFSITVGL